MTHFDTWSAWTKIWIAGELYGDLWLLRTCLRYLASGDRSHLVALEHTSPPFQPRIQAQIDEATGVLTQMERGALSHTAAAQAMLSGLAQSDWLPHNAYAWGETDVHHGDFTPEATMPKIVLWGKTRSPEWVRKGLFDFPIGPLLKMKLTEKLGREVTA